MIGSQIFHVSGLNTDRLPFEEKLPCFIADENRSTTIPVKYASIDGNKDKSSFVNGYNKENNGAALYSILDTNNPDENISFAFLILDSILSGKMMRNITMITNDY